MREQMGEPAIRSPRTWTWTVAALRLGVSLSVAAAWIHHLGLKVVAAWVGDEQAVTRLRGLGVDFAQGCYLHQPELAVCFR